MGIHASIPVTTGVVRPVELFVAVLGASNYTYVEATDTQRSADFIQSHSHAVEYVGGVPAAIVPRSAADGHPRPVPLRTDSAAHLRRVGRALLLGDRPRETGEAS